MRIQRRFGRGRLLLLVLLALSVVIITLDFRSEEGGIIDGAKDVTATIVEPVQRGFTAVFRPIGNIFSSIGELGSLRSENEKLRTEVESLRETISQAEQVLAENRELRLMLDLDEPWAAMESVAAEVTSKIPGNFRWQYTIDKGAAEGIEVDMTVINTDGLVGKILAVRDHSATVQTLIDPDAGAGASLEEKRYSGTIEGEGAGQLLTLKFVDGDVPVEPGDEVQTSYLGGTLYPPNIPIGFVSTVDGGSGADPELKVGVEPHVDFTRLDFVFVLLDSGPNLVDAD